MAVDKWIKEQVMHLVSAYKLNQRSLVLSSFSLAISAVLLVINVTKPISDNSVAWSVFFAIATLTNAFFIYIIYHSLQSLRKNIKECAEKYPGVVHLPHVEKILNEHKPSK